MRVSGLIVGLGNPGSKYVGTRHNFGFMVLDALVQGAKGENGCVRSLHRGKDFDLWSWTVDGKEWLLLKPLAYMNLSGKAVQIVYDRFYLEPQLVLVIHDELDLALGSLKFKLGGGLAGHNGLKSIHQHLGTKDFYRLRLGIGRPILSSEASAYVLSRFSSDETGSVGSVVDRAREAVLLFCRQGFQTAIQDLHTSQAQKQGAPDGAKTAVLKHKQKADA